MSSAPDKKWQLWVYALIRNNKEECLLVRRKRAKSDNGFGKWELPGASLSNGEDVSKSVAREAKKLGLIVDTDTSLFTTHWEMDGKAIACLLMTAVAKKGRFKKNGAYTEFKWVEPGKIDDLPLSPQLRPALRRYAQEYEAKQPPKPKGADPSALTPPSLKKHIRNFRSGTDRYKRLADFLLETLTTWLRPMFTAPQISVRPKGAGSFAGKLIKKCKYKDPLSEITDLAGGRVVLPLQSDVELACQWIQKNFEIDSKNSEDKLTKLGTDRFGYLSVHYVIEIREKEGQPFKIPKDLLGLKAELQVRTIVQHAWSEIGHDRLYKSGCDVPDYWKREANRVAALLEAADHAFARVAQGVDAYQHYQRKAATPDEAAKLLDLWDAALKEVPDDSQIALTVARLALDLGRWDKAISVVNDFPDPKPATLVCAKGYALCKLGPARHSKNWSDGLDELKKAAGIDPQYVEPHLRLGELWSAEQNREALRHFERAFKIDSSHPEALSGYIRTKVFVENSIAFVPLLKPDIEAAIKRCQDLVAAKADIPQALYRIAGFRQLLGVEHANQSLSDFCTAVSRTRSVEPLLTALLDAWQLARVEPGRHDFECACRFLYAALMVKFPSEARLPKEFEAPFARPLTLDSNDRVVIVAGGCDVNHQSAMAAYGDMLKIAFADFQGIVISGGTKEGISGLVGELGDTFKERIRTIGYLPRSLYNDGTATKDSRYHDVRNSDGRESFSACEPIQNWLDLLASNINPAHVRLLGINGGQVAGLEYRLALALGAEVGIIQGSGREAERLINEWPRDTNDRLSVVPPDPMTIRAFLLMQDDAVEDFSAENVDKLARLTHQDFLDQQRYNHSNPVMQSWAKLRSDLRDSNRSQIRYLVSILRSEGFEIRDCAGEPRDPHFTDEEVERMAEKEHGRWNAERSRSGWKHGDTKDIEKKITPYLVSWEVLKRDMNFICDYDRKNVRLWPETLAAIGLEIRRPKKGRK